MKNDTKQWHRYETIPSVNFITKWQVGIISGDFNRSLNICGFRPDEEEAHSAGTDKERKKESKEGRKA